MHFDFGTALFVIGVAAAGFVVYRAFKANAGSKLPYQNTQQK